MPGKHKIGYDWHKHNTSAKGKERFRRYNLKHKFGITIDDYERMFKAQEGKCAICGRADGGRKDGWRLAVDHDHTTGETRGLLCTNCNQGLGRFYDNSDLLLKASNYLVGLVDNKVT